MGQLSLLEFTSESKYLIECQEISQLTEYLEMLTFHSKAVKSFFFCSATSFGHSTLTGFVYRVIHMSVKHLKNSQQIDYATDHSSSYVDRERNY